MADPWASSHGDAGRSGDRRGARPTRRRDGIAGAPRPGDVQSGGRQDGGEPRDADGRADDEGRDARRNHPAIAFLRSNPQVFVLLVICVVLGLGTFIAVLLGLLTAGSGHLTGEPSGAILGARSAMAAADSIVF